MNFYQVYPFQEIKLALQSTNRTNKSGESLRDTNLDSETKQYQLIKKFFKVLKDITL